jgi:hypothetical protein
MMANGSSNVDILNQYFSTYTDNNLTNKKSENYTDYIETKNITQTFYSSDENDEKNKGIRFTGARIIDDLMDELFLHSSYFLSIINYILVFGIENIKVIDYDDVIVDSRVEGRERNRYLYVYIRIFKCIYKCIFMCMYICIHTDI